MRCDDFVWLTQRIGTKTRPGISSWLGDHASSNRVRLYIAHARHQVPIRIHQCGSEATFPQSSGPSVSRIDIPDVPATDTLHQPSEAYRRSWSEKQVHMIAHQHVCVNCTRGLLGSDVQCFKVFAVIRRRKENSLPVVASLHNVHGYIGYHASWETWHPSYFGPGVTCRAHDQGVRVLEPRFKAIKGGDQGVRVVEPQYKYSDPLNPSTLTP
jgi:hypothetical protein